MTAVTVSTCQSCQWNVINLKHQQSKINVVKCSDLCAFVDGRGNYYPWPFWGFYASVASTWFGLHHAKLKVVVLQPTVVWDLGASFSSPGCFVFEIWVLRALLFVFKCFIFETTLYSLSWPSSKGSSWYPSVSHQSFQENLWMYNERKSLYTIKKSGKVVGRERHTL